MKQVLVFTELVSERKCLKCVRKFADTVSYIVPAVTDTIQQRSLLILRSSVCLATAACS